MPRRLVVLPCALALLSFARSAVGAAPTVRTDCRDHRLSKTLVIRACLRDDALSITLGGVRGRAAVELKQRIDPQGTFDERVTVTAHNEAWVALAWDDAECTVAVLVERATGRLAASSGCTNARYCRFPAAPALKACRAELQCREGDLGLRGTWVELCEDEERARSGSTQ